MTVCIAAIYGNGSGCILASDQMTTAHFPIGYEFENEEVEKIVKINDNIYVLISGDVLFANEVISLTNQRIRVDNIQTVFGIVEVFRNSYQLARRNRIARNELEPRGIDLNTFLNLQQKLLPALVQIIDQAFRTFNPQVEFIIAGKDGASWHVYTVRNPGDLICHDPIGFVAIGSGGPHAVYSLIESNYKKSLDKDTIKEAVKKAKERSEVAPGVGKKTKVVEL